MNTLTVKLRESETDASWLFFSCRATWTPDREGAGGPFRDPGQVRQGALDRGPGKLDYISSAGPGQLRGRLSELRPRAGTSSCGPVPKMEKIFKSWASPRIFRSTPPRTKPARLQGGLRPDAKPDSPRAERPQPAGLVSLRLGGTLDVATLPQFEQALNRLRASGRAKIIVDLAGLSTSAVPAWALFWYGGPLPQGRRRPGLCAPLGKCKRSSRWASTAC